MFIVPSGLAMLIFIAAPIFSVLLQSVYAPHQQVTHEVENCDLFGCTKTLIVDAEATKALLVDRPLGRFVGAGIFADHNHLAIEEVGSFWSGSSSFVAFFHNVLNLPFYSAIAFTLTYTTLVTPLAILLGFAIALCVNGIPRILRGPTIFISLLPMIVTPLVGALILFWMVDARGILGIALQSLVGQPDLSIIASTSSITSKYASLFVYLTPDLRQGTFES